MCENRFGHFWPLWPSKIYWWPWWPVWPRIIFVCILMLLQWFLADFVHWPFNGHKGQKWPNPFSHNLDHYSNNSEGPINFWYLVWKLEPFKILGDQKWVYAHYFWECIGILNFMHYNIVKCVSEDIATVYIHFTSLLFEISMV